MAYSELDSETTHSHSSVELQFKSHKLGAKYSNHSQNKESNDCFDSDQDSIRNNLLFPSIIVTKLE